MARVYRPDPSAKGPAAGKPRPARPETRTATHGKAGGAASRVVVRGAVRELRVGGTYASHYEPGRVLTGSVWDALGASLLALPEAQRRRVLLLGLGGGSVARIVRELAPRARITGVEIDPAVVTLARRHLGLDALDVDVVVSDAGAYLARCRAHFDAVIEDVFVGGEATLRKPPGFPSPGLDRAAGRLTPGGVLASNTIDETDEVHGLLRRHFQRVVRIGVDGYDNRVLVATAGPLSGRGLRRAVAASPVLRPALGWLAFRSLSDPRRGTGEPSR
jgi:SAM-dependent methyltransferase